MTSSIKVALTCAMGLVFGSSLYESVGTPSLPPIQLLSVITIVSIIIIISNSKLALLATTCAIGSFIASITYDSTEGVILTILLVTIIAIIGLTIDKIDKHID